MVLILLGRKGQDHFDRGNSFFWELLSRCFAKLVLEVRSFASILEKGFWDNLFDNYRETVDEEMAKENKQTEREISQVPPKLAALRRGEERKRDVRDRSWVAF
ncbi:salicylate carboxymethyltransferase-like, partial [Fagus crenata]